MADDDLQTALAWVQSRLDRRLSVDNGTVDPDDVLARGREPGFTMRPERDSYDLDIYVRLASVGLTAESMGVAHASDEELVIDTPAGRITFRDTED